MSSSRTCVAARPPFWGLPSGSLRAQQMPSDPGRLTRRDRELTRVQSVNVALGPRCPKRPCARPAALPIVPRVRCPRVAERVRALRMPVPSRNFSKRRVTRSQPDPWAATAVVDKALALDPADPEVHRTRRSSTRRDASDSGWSRGTRTNHPQARAGGADTRGSSATLRWRVLPPVDLARYGALTTTCASRSTARR